MIPGEPETSELIARTRAIYASLNSRDFDAVTAMFAPAGVWDVTSWGLGSKSGREAIRHFLTDWFGSLAEYEVRIEELHDLGAGVVLAVVLQVGRRTGSRGELQVRSAPVFLWDQDGIAQVTLYRDLEAARLAAQELAEARALAGYA
ncbi:MAG: nuclear transport factor 2 family protein [Solirubrobacterales bacterium]|nr:nuclear transport factor 2 family protein [Solirubrobacterales bacterium]